MDLLPDHLSTVDDFLHNDAFRTWLLERRPESQLYWQQWLEQYPEKKDLYEQAVATFLVLKGKSVKPSSQEILNKAESILGQLPTSTREIKLVTNWQWGWWAAAVIALLIWWRFDKPAFQELASVVTGTQQGQKLPLRADDWQLVKNITGIPLVVLLPDNSSVLLSTGSQLRFRRQNQAPVREVFLEGEGFFEVTKNPTRPFFVYTKNLTTKVLGTSFQVRSFGKEGAAYVKVKTGKVAVTPADSPDTPVLLTVNQQLSLEAKTDKVVKRAIIPSEENSSSIISQQFTFEYVPVPDIFARLEASYHMPILYDRNQLANCTFTGQLTDVPFLEKIRLICLTIESTYEIVDNQVIIHSHRCH